MSRITVCLAACFCLLALTAFGALNLPQSITAQAEGPGGAHVGFTVSVVDGNDGSNGRPADTVTCTPPSLSLFPIGTTTVACVGSEGSTGSFTVTVVDTLAPALSLPRDFTVVTTSPTGEAVTYTAGALDLVDGSVAVVCTPPSGSTFPIGTTAVSCTASDSAGNTATGGFNITLVTSTPPPGNSDITAEATEPGGARVTFNTGDEDDDDGRPGSGGCSPAPGSLFPLGETTVICPSGNFTVLVVDTTPPLLSLPAQITVTATSPSVVTFAATASDLVDGSVAVACTPPSGSTFALGTTTVNCSASDSRDNSSTGSFQVTVTEDSTPGPVEITVEATGPDGAVVNLGIDGPGRTVTCIPASGSTFPLGVTEVNCDNGAEFIVTVVDTTPPTLSLPADITIEATGPSGATVTFLATALDLVDGVVPADCTPPSGSTFALGTTTVNCSATDAHDNTSNGSFTVTVVDTTPPVITAVTVTPASLWPPNKRLVTTTVTVSVTDLVDPAPIVQIYDITCDEALAPGDATITGPLTASLRADRDAQQDGRVYTLHIEAIDASGNRTTATVTVIVPHDQSGAVVTEQAPAKRRATGRR